MRLILLTMVASIVVGLAAGGSLRGFPHARPRWPWLALLGVALQLLLVSGPWAFAALLASFALLIAFAVTNLRLPGVALVLVGLSLNALVIGANGGMPVTRHALEASGQHGTLRELVEDGDGQKHLLADDGTILVFLGDAIPIPRPVAQAISVGDVFIHLGVAWFIVASMRRRRTRLVADSVGA